MTCRKIVPILGAVAIVSAGLWIAVTSWASDVGVLGSAVSLSSVTITGKQKLKSVQKGGNVHVGATTTPANLSGQLEIYYVDAPANKAVLAIPAPWTSVSPTVARYKNSLAPAGPTPVRTAVISTGRVAKVTGKGLGGLDIATPPGAGGVITVLTVQNAGDASTHRMCSLYALGNGSVITHKVNSTGYKLTLKKGVETACPACADGIKNGNETAIDCGGSCGPCDDGETCNGAADCLSAVCTSGVCQPALCTDGLRNGTESDVDCGGTCPGCPNGADCTAGTDCQSLVCTGGACQPTQCSDGVKNGSETGVDCGNGCPDCPAGQGCDSSDDCVSNVCTGGICQSALCSDGVQNGNETDVDCGGSCPDCANGKHCSIAGDCQSAVYTGGMVVSHKARKYTARWWTQGEEPGTTGEWGVWQDNGAC